MCKIQSMINIEYAFYLQRVPTGHYLVWWIRAGVGVSHGVINILKVLGFRVTVSARFRVSKLIGQSKFSSTVRVTRT